MVKSKIIQCANDQRWDDAKADFVPCTEKATTSRKTYRFGDASKGEPAIVHCRVSLCAHCAELWDESEQEAEWEAKVS